MLLVCLNIHRFCWVSQKSLLCPFFIFFVHISLMNTSIAVCFYRHIVFHWIGQNDRAGRFLIGKLSTAKFSASWFKMNNWPKYLTFDWSYFSYLQTWFASLSANAFFCMCMEDFASKEVTVRVHDVVLLHWCV